MPSDWQQTTVHDAKTGVTQAILRHGSGLVVTREMRVFPKFDAVEYTLRFKNTATRSLPAISMLRSIDLSFESVVNGNCVVSSGGGLATGTLPPKTFAIRKSCFSTATSSAGFYVDLATEGGRSSNKDLPFFFIDNPAKREGAFIAFGWSGQWRATVAHDKFDDRMVKKLTDAAAAIDQEYFLLDAGWYEGTIWFDSVGNWERVSKLKLPNGLKRRRILRDEREESNDRRPGNRAGIDVIQGVDLRGSINGAQMGR